MYIMHPVHHTSENLSSVAITVVSELWYNIVATDMLIFLLAEIHCCHLLQAPR